MLPNGLVVQQSADNADSVHKRRVHSLSNHVAHKSNTLRGRKHLHLEVVAYLVLEVLVEIVRVLVQCARRVSQRWNKSPEQTNKLFYVLSLEMANP